MMRRPASIPAKDLRRRFRTVDHGLLLALGAFLLYLSQGRAALHGYDAFEALVAAQGGGGRSHGHFLYFPLARAAGVALAPIVPGAFEAVRTLSAFGVAVGVFFAYRSALALRTHDPALVALAVAVTPAAVYFGATIEVDGLVLGATSLAWWLWARLARERRVRSALTVGVVTGLAAGLHGGVHLMVASACALFASRAVQRAWGRRSLRPVRRAAMLLLAAAMAHAVVHLATSQAFGHRGQLTMAANTRLLSLSSSRLTATVEQEWLLPYAPFSVLWAGCLLLPSLRWVGTAFAVCLAGYLAFTAAVMGYFEPLGPALRERGAFAIGMLVPTVLLAAAWMRRRTLWISIATAAAIALVDVRREDWEPVPTGFGAALRDLAGRESIELWTSGFEREAGWVRKCAGHLRQMPIPALPRELARLERGGLDVTAAHVSAWFDRHYDGLQAQRVSLLLTEEAMAAMRADSDPRIRFLIEQHVPRHYRLEAIEQPPLRASRVRRQ